MTGMWDNVVRVNGVVREDLHTALDASSRKRNTNELDCRPIRMCGEDEEATDMWEVAGEDQPW